MKLLVLVAGFVVFFVAQTTVIEWTPGFGLAFTAGGTLTGPLVRAELGRWH
ncbi:MAG TPA: hypothetical protein VM325_18825 [Alphaproteobacteria bacterium]|nr:hypothetical protein [Alphaproteobacteria bacterium]